MGQDQHEDEDATSKPFQGVVVCCTSIPPDQRTDIAKRTADMGGIHKYDLTPDVTHLIVGEYDTPKYRHVAKERPDIVPMTSGWIYEAREMWMADQEFDFATLEAKWKLKTFESGGGDPDSSDPASRENKKLLCCLTGFEDHMRSMIEQKVRANGGEYVGDLSKKVTHLITYKPEGKKYKAAVNWGIRTVSIEWLHDSVERGMILSEDCYDPTLPQEERGVGAWTRKEVRRDTTGKRLRDNATATASVQGRRKLRKTASMKLMSQNESLWGDILNQQSSANQSMVELGDGRSSLNGSRVEADESMMSKYEDSTLHDETVPSKDKAEQPEGAGGLFDLCRFYVHDFSPGQTEIIRTHLISNGGRISTSVDDLASPIHPEPSSRRFLLVAQTSQPDSHPTLPEGVHIVTEFYIERCVHGKRLADPNEHVLGRPFPRFPIPGLAELAVCTTGFKNEQLHQVYKAVTQIGGRYEERLKAGVSLLVAPSIDHVHKQKLEFARGAGIPVIDAEWLWQCIRTGFLVPWDKYLLQKPEKSEKPNSTIDGDTASAAATKEQLREKRRSLQKTTSEPVPISKRLPRAGTTQPVSLRPPPKAAGVDQTAFEDDGPVPGEDFAAGGESHYDTARTHQPPSVAVDTSVGTARPGSALRDASSNALNKSPSSPQRKSADLPDNASRRQSDRNFRRVPTGGTVADSDGGDSVSTSRHGTEPPPDDEAATAEATRKRDREREKQEKAAREKEEMSRRLNSLMSSHREDGGGSDTNSVGGPAFDESIGGAGGAEGGTGAGPRPQRRKREVLGRAISNVSTASSNASADSSSTPVAVSSATTHLKTPAAAPDSFSSTGGGSGARHQLLDKMLDHAPTAEGSPSEGERGRRKGQGQGQEDGPTRRGSSSRGEDENPPPATQLGYDVPEARLYRAAIMDRMLRRKGGSGSSAAATTATTGQDKEEEEKKPTLASVSARMGASGGGGGAAASTTTTRRTTRRQKGF